VITSHAVTVPVTEGLNAGMDGYLPIHCIYQLLKGRAFSKYKVHIKVTMLLFLSNTYKPIHVNQNIPYVFKQAYQFCKILRHVH